MTLRCPRVPTLALSLALALSWGCSHQGPSSKTPASVGQEIVPVEVSDTELATQVNRLLLSRERNDEDLRYLAGAVRRQLTRAEGRFAAKEPRAGSDALTGAFLLVHTGELTPNALRGLEAPLKHGADEAARVGNAGRARALYRILEPLLSAGGKQTDVRDHLRALEVWSRPTATESRLETAGRLQRASVQEALVDPHPSTLATARDHVTAWVHAALASDVAERPITTPDERDEALEAYRAVRSGGAVLAGLYLRHGNPLGALRALEDAQMSRIVPPALRDRLQRAGEDDDAQAWLDLFRLYDGSTASETPETALDPELARGAAFGAAVGLYRSSPGDAEAAMPLSMLLVELGMADAASTLLAQNLDRKASPEALSWALTLVLRAMVSEEDAGSVDGARRTFDGALPLLALAEEPAFAQVSPRPGRIKYLMGAFETKAGRLDRALPLIRESVKSTPTVSALQSLSAIERQEGHYEEALNSLRAGLGLAQSSGDVVAEAECEELAFQIYRELGQAEPALAALGRALERARAAQELNGAPENVARIERLLARIYEHYGEGLAARKASLRALEASRSNVHQIAATLTDIARRGLVLGDLRSARLATEEALRAELPPEDLVYIALWQRLVERQLDARDGLAEEAFASVTEQGTWVASLRDWGRGRIGDQALYDAAKDEAQRTEAAFYAAMAARVTGQPGAGIEGLKRVAKSPVIDLVEVSIARDLTAPNVAPRLPPGTTLP